MNVGVHAGRQDRLRLRDTSRVPVRWAFSTRCTLQIPALCRIADGIRPTDRILALVQAINARGVCVSRAGLPPLRWDLAGMPGEGTRLSNKGDHDVGQRGMPRLRREVSSPQWLGRKIGKVSGVPTRLPTANSHGLADRQSTDESPEQGSLGGKVRGGLQRLQKPRHSLGHSRSSKTPPAEEPLPEESVREEPRPEESLREEPPPEEPPPEEPVCEEVPPQEPPPEELPAQEMPAESPVSQEPPMVAEPSTAAEEEAGPVERLGPARHGSRTRAAKMGTAGASAEIEALPEPSPYVRADEPPSDEKPAGTARCCPR